MKFAYVLAAATVAAVLCSQTSTPDRVGKLPNGGFLLNSGWRLTPAGAQIPLDTLPMSTALTPDKQFLLILHGGYRLPCIVVYDIKNNREVSRVTAPDLWLGLAIAPNGRTVYAGGGAKAVVQEFALSPAGELTFVRSMAASKTPGTAANEDFVGDVTISPDGHLIYAALLNRNEVHILNPQSAMVIEELKVGRRPYRLLFHPDGKSFFVTSWADGTLYHYEAETGKRLGHLPLGAHTTDMVWKLSVKEGAPDKLYVAAANTNKVFVVAVSEAKDLSVAETINVSMTPLQPAGMTPSAVGLSPDGARLYVACSDANVVAVVDVSEERSKLRGFIPVGWYPTAVRALPDGRLFVLNGRGSQSYPNPTGPNPTKHITLSHLGEREDQYVGKIQTGTASLLAPFDDEQLREYTRTAMQNSPYRDEYLDSAFVPAGNPIPSSPGDPSPIKHVIYIVKENRTYDQVLGDVKAGNSDAALTIFDEKTGPNHHKLARDFVLFDNFYVNADVSADGHNWSSSAIANDYVEKLWPSKYANRRKTYDFEGGEPAALPPAGYLWTNAHAAGISMRNFGWWCVNKPREKGEAPVGEQILSVKDALLAPVTDRNYRGFDLDYPDIDRAKVFLTALQGMEQANQMPQLIFMRLGNDHTSGVAANKIAPLSSFADNDAALGQIVAAVSKSKFWSTTAIFVLEDDAQNGPDHVDSHRSPAFILSPYTRRSGAIDSTMYNTASMLRTMELILGLRPMTQFDAAARPMWAAFTAKPNLTPYEAEAPRISLTDRNPAGTAKAAAMAKMDFTEADQVDDDEMNEALWRAIRKTDPPPPVRSYFGR